MRRALKHDLENKVRLSHPKITPENLMYPNGFYENLKKGTLTTKNRPKSKRCMAMQVDSYRDLKSPVLVDPNQIDALHQILQRRQEEGYEGKEL